MAAAFAFAASSGCTMMLWSDHGDSPPRRNHVTELVAASCTRAGELHLQFERVNPWPLLLVATRQADHWRLALATQPAPAPQPDDVPVRIVEPFRAWRLRQRPGGDDGTPGADDPEMLVALGVREAGDRNGFWIRDVRGERAWTYVPLPEPGYAWATVDFAERVLVTPLTVAFDVVALPLYVPALVMLLSGAGH